MAQQVVLSTSSPFNGSLDTGIDEFDFFPNDLWKIIGKCILCITYHLGMGGGGQSPNFWKG